MKYKIVKYSDIGIIRSGKRLPKGDNILENKTANKYIRVRDIINGKIDEKNVKFISDDVAKRLERYRVKKGDVIISVVGTIGNIAKISSTMDGAYLTENCNNLLVDEQKCKKEYLKYFLISEKGQEEIRANTVGSTQPKLPIYGIENFNIILPDLSAQDKIAKLLSSIDRKIDINNQINDNLLEEVA